MNNIDKQRVEILKEYRLYSLLYNDYVYSSIYESNFINDILAGTESDRAEIKALLKKLRVIIPELMLKVAKVGGKVALNALVKSVKEVYKASKSHPEATKKLLIGLISIVIAYGGYNIIKSYNNHPVFPDTYIEYVDIDDEIDGILYTDSVGNQIEAVYIEDENIVEYTDIDNSKPSVKIKGTNGPIVLLSTGVKKTSYYTVSEHMSDALMEVEDFKPMIYDARNPRRKITQKDMTDMSLDLTIGYGHKLTKQERNSWKFNKRVTTEEAKKLFLKDLKSVETIANNKLKELPYNSQVEYSQGFFDGFVSLLFNMGSGNMFGNANRQPSEFWKRLQSCRIDTKNQCINKNDLDYTIAQVNNQNVIMNGHKTRRRAEYFIMSQNVGELNAKLYKIKTKS